MRRASNFLVLDFFQEGFDPLGGSQAASRSFQLVGDAAGELFVSRDCGELKLASAHAHVRGEARHPEGTIRVSPDARHKQVLVRPSKKSKNESKNNVKRFQCRRCRKPLFYA